MKINIYCYIKITNDLFCKPDCKLDFMTVDELKKYVTALIKKQWGSNLSKFAGVQLPGGVQLNGPQIYAEALQEIQIIEQEFYSQYELPIDFIVA